MRGRARRSLFLMMLVILCGLVLASDGVFVVVVWPDVWGTYVAVDEQDTLGAVGTPDDPAGTYTWWKNSGPGNVYWEGDPEEEIGYGMAPSFSADERGIYTVEVEFELEGETANAISGDITVFEVCLGIDGVDDSEEETPGGFVCEDGPRKKIMLTLETMDRTIPPAAMSLDPDGSNRIEIWTQETGGQKRYPHENFPYYRPVEWDCDGEPPHDEFPSELWVQGVEVSGAPRDVIMTLMYEITEQNWFYPVIGTDVVKFTILEVEILEPEGSLDANPNPESSWSGTAPYHFDFQGVTSDSPGGYALGTEGSISPAALDYQWTLDAAAGTLTDETTATPTHHPPGQPGQGTLTLKAMDGATYTGISDTRTVKIYQDHLARDRDDFGVGISCSGDWSFTRFNVTISMGDTWNCHGSTNHAYIGSGNGYANDLLQAIRDWDKDVFTPPIDWEEVAAELDRGDVVAFYSGEHDLEHSHSCLGGPTMYSANNEAVKGDPTWKWAECTSEHYWNTAGTDNPPWPDCNELIIYNRP